VQHDAVAVQIAHARESLENQKIERALQIAFRQNSPLADLV